MAESNRGNVLVAAVPRAMLESSGWREEEMMLPLARVYGMLAVVALLWGLVFIAIKLGGRILPIDVFNADRFLLGAALLGLAAWRTGQWQRIGWRDAWQLSVIGVLSGLIQVTFAAGVLRTATASSALIYGCTPILVAALSVALGLERLGARQWLGALLALGGMAAVVVGGTAKFAGQTLAGDGLVLLSVVLLAVYVVASRPLLMRLNVLFVTAWVFGVAAIVLLICSVPHQSAELYRQLDARGWLILLYGAVFALALPNLLFFAGIKAVGRVKAALVMNAVPVVGCAAGWLVMGETMSLFQFSGSGLILAGVLLAQMRNRPGTQDDNA